MKQFKIGQIGYVKHCCKGYEYCNIPEGSKGKIVEMDPFPFRPPAPNNKLRIMVEFGEGKIKDHVCPECFHIKSIKETICL